MDSAIALQPVAHHLASASSLAHRRVPLNQNGAMPAAVFLHRFIAAC